MFWYCFSFLSFFCILSSYYFREILARQRWIPETGWQGILEQRQLEQEGTCVHMFPCTQNRSMTGKNIGVHTGHTRCTRHMHMWHPRNWHIHLPYEQAYAVQVDTGEVKWENLARNFRCGNKFLIMHINWKILLCLAMSRFLFPQ